MPSSDGKPATDPLPIDATAVRRAHQAIAGKVLRTPTVELPALGAHFGGRAFAKLENLQLTGSFKVRGALNRLLALDDAARTRGVVAASAGNHAQGVAYHARRLGIRATIVMPNSTPFTKVSRTEALDAAVVLFGDGLAEARAEAERVAETTGATYIHPYNDPLVMAGQGTAGLELLEDAGRALDDLIVPVGGGGLIAGVATIAKAINPSIRVIGVQASSHTAMLASVFGGSGGEGDGSATIAEGIAVKGVGDLTRAVIAERVDEIVAVDEPAIEAAVMMMMETEHVMAEGAGAVPVAAVLADPERFAGRTVGLIVSGGNIDARLLGSILMRGLVRDGRIARLRIEIPDRPGSLAQVTRLIGEAGADIVEIYHQRLFYDVPIRMAELDVVLETRDPGHVAQLVDRLIAAGFKSRVLSGRDSG